MEDKITLDRETFKALAIDTRVNILKKLDERFQLTLTDLAGELDMAPSTIKEHLDKLVSAGLIRQADKGMKWKYYRLTSKGKQILNPHEKRVWIILSVSVLALFAAVYRLLLRLEQLASPVWNQNLIAGEAGEGALRGAPPDVLHSKSIASSYDAVNETLVDKADTITEQAVSAASQMPYAELMVVLILVLAVGVCVGYLIRKKKIL